MWYTLCVLCPFSKKVRKVGVFFNRESGYFLFNFCDFSNAVTPCSACERFCRDFITSHADSQTQKGTIEHPLHF